MKIAVDLQSLQTRQSRNRGIGRYVRALLEALLPLSEASGGPEYVLYSHAGLQAPDLSEQWERRIHALPFLPEPEGKEGDSSVEINEVNEAILRTFLLHQNVDAVFVPSPMEILEAVLPDFGDFPATLVSISYDLIPLVFAERYLPTPEARNRYLQRLGNLRAADRALCISEATRRDTMRLLEMSDERAVFIGGGVGPEFRPLSDAERATWRTRFAEKWGLTRSFIMFTGGGDKRKNMDGLIDAYARLPVDLRERFQLVLVCHLAEPEEKELRDRAKELGLPLSSLLLTNFVTDDELIALYGLTDLFVFPSLYEGFGLPLVEAMACGAAVATGNNSSLVEIVSAPDQLFDSSSVDSIATHLETLLRDDALRARLASQAVEEAKNFTWETVAARVHDALTQIPPRPPANPEFVRPAPVAAGKTGARKRLAYFSPFPPLPSGISDYSAELLQPLSALYDCDLYADGGYRPCVETERPLRTYHQASFEGNLLRRRMDYQALVYQMGNSSYHAYIYAHLMRYAGITVLHDYNLSGLIAWADSQKPEWGITLEHELFHAYGEKKGRELHKAIHSGELAIKKLPEQGIYLSRRVFTRSVGVIVHSRWAYDLAQSEHGDGPHMPPLALIPHFMSVPEQKGHTDDARRRLREQYGIPGDAFVFASAGIVAPTKRPLAILDAFKAQLAVQPKAFLVFVGGLDMPSDFGAEIARRGLSERVKVTGYVEGMETFYDYLRLADVALTLRYPSNGETSGALLRILSVGRAAIVSDIGTFGEYPDHIVHKITTPDRGDEVGELTRAMRLLSEDADYRARLGQEARAYVAREHDPVYCARLYQEFIERVMQDPRTRRRLLADYAGRAAARAIGIQPLDAARRESVLDAFASVLGTGCAGCDT